MTRTARCSQRKLRRDLRTLARFVETYCHDKHGERPTSVVAIKTHDVTGICGGPVTLCRDCQKLLMHSFVKRTTCPFDPKPACKKCPSHCYAANYREAMRSVMKYSGRRLVMSGRIHYLWHLLF